MLQYRINFSNYVAIVTESKYTGDVLFDGKAITQWIAASSWGYSYAAFAVTHGMHFITTRNSGGSACFVAYLYGHSLQATSSGGYGFTVGYKRKNFNFIVAVTLTL